MASIERRVTSAGKVTWRARVRLQGELPISKTFTRKTDADTWAREIEARADRGYAIPSRDQIMRPLADAIDQWIEHRLPEMARTDQPNVRRCLEWWRSKLGSLALTKITPEIVERAARTLRDERDERDNLVRTPQRVNRYLSSLSRVLGYTVKTLRWIEANPCTSVRRFKEPPGRVRFLAPAEVDRLLAAVDGRRDKEGNAKPQFSLFVRVALFTGARRGEVAGLRWCDVDPVHQRITFRDTKNGTDRTVPMASALVAAFREFATVRPLKPDTPIFPHDFRFDWREVQGVLPDFRMHDLRHNVASQLAMSGASLLDIAEVTGHKTLAMVKRYSHLSDQHVRSKIEEAAARIVPAKAKK